MAPKFFPRNLTLIKVLCICILSFCMYGTLAVAAVLPGVPEMGNNSVSPEYCTLHKRNVSAELEFNSPILNSTNANITTVNTCVLDADHNKDSAHVDATHERHLKCQHVDVRCDAPASTSNPHILQLDHPPSYPIQQSTLTCNPDGYPQAPDLFNQLAITPLQSTPKDAASFNCVAPARGCAIVSCVDIYAGQLFKGQAAVVVMCTNESVDVIVNCNDIGNIAAWADNSCVAESPDTTAYGPLVSSGVDTFDTVGNPYKISTYRYSESVCQQVQTQISTQP